MAYRQYIGARYVPAFFENSATGDSTWAANTAYEALTMVQWNNVTYTSKKPVPASVGNPASAPEYWIVTSNVNAQVAELASQIADVDDRVEDIETDDAVRFSNDVLKVSNGGTGASNAASARANLGLGSAATENVMPISKGGTGANTASDARVNLGLGDVSVEDVLPIDKGGTGASTAANARDNLGLGDVAVEDVLPISKGGTGATTIEGARAIFSGTKVSLLWSNSNPNSSFAGQTLQLALSSYNLIIVELAYTPTSYVTTVIAVLGSLPAQAFVSSGLVASGVPVVCVRTVQMLANGVLFGDAYYTTTTSSGAGTVDNARLVPHRIYGVTL